MITLGWIYSDTTRFIVVFIGRNNQLTDIPAFTSPLTNARNIISIDLSVQLHNTWDHIAIKDVKIQISGGALEVWPWSLS